MMMLTTEEFIKKSNDIHHGKYDYSKSVYRGGQRKIIITCPKHGDFEQLANNHMNLGKGCQKCFIEKQKLSFEEWITKARKKHGDKYDYSKVDYKNIFTPVDIICPKHGCFKQIPVNHYRGGDGCPKCSQSHGEEQIRLWLENNNIDFEEQKKFKQLGHLSYDFFLPSKNILIEYNGEQHYKPIEFFGGEEKFKIQKEHDIKKREFALKNKIKFLEIKYNVDIIDTLNNGVLV